MTDAGSAVWDFLLPLPWVVFAFIATRRGFWMRGVGWTFSRETTPRLYKGFLAFCALIIVLSVCAGVFHLLRWKAIGG
jgi:hypothetical protein